jgi:hypothetical protein
MARNMPEPKKVEYKMSEAGRAVKEGIVMSLRGVNEIEAEIVSLVRNVVSDSLKATGGIAGESVAITKEVMKGAIAATEEVGHGLVMSTKSVAKGIIMGVSDVGGDVVKSAGQIAQGAVKGASEIGADVAIVGRRAIDGVIEATKEIGGNVEQVAVEAVGGAVKAAGTIGNTAVTAMRDLLVGAAGGVKDVLAAAMPSHDAHPSPGGAAARQAPTRRAGRRSSARRTSPMANGSSPRFTPACRARRFKVAGSAAGAGALEERLAGSRDHQLLGERPDGEPSRHLRGGHASASRRDAVRGGPVCRLRGVIMDAAAVGARVCARAAVSSVPAIVAARSRTSPAATPAAVPPAALWHGLSPEEALARLGSGPLGISRTAAIERLRLYGPNRLTEKPPRSGLEMFLGQFASFPVALLAGAAGLSILTGGIADAALIAAVVREHRHRIRGRAGRRT